MTPHGPLYCLLYRAWDAACTAAYFLAGTVLSIFRRRLP